MTETSDEDSVEYIYESDADEDEDFYIPANLVVDQEQRLMRPLLLFDTDKVDICNLYNR
jgi:hypothetical protein